MLTTTEALHFVVDTGCSRNLMSRSDLPKGAEITNLEHPITYRTANGLVTATQEAKFIGQVQDHQGRRHRYRHRTCVVPTRCASLFSVGSADGFCSSGNQAQLNLEGDIIPLQPHKEGMWTLPVFR